MMVAWLIAFLVGQLVGRVPEVEARLVPMLLVFLPLTTMRLVFCAGGGALALVVARRLRPARPRGCAYRRYLARLGLWSAAGLWGAVHATAEPPHIDDDLSLAEILHVDPVSTGAGQGPVLVAWQGIVFGASAPRWPGALCRPRIKPVVEPFARYRASCTVVLGRSPPLTVLDQQTQALRRRLDWRLEQLPARLRPWLRALLLGDKRSLPHGLLLACQRLGIAHLMSVSGLHVALLVPLFSLVLRVPLQLAYALRGISGPMWRHCLVILGLVTSGIAVVYMALADAPLAAQRATVALVLWQLGGLFWGKAPLPTRLQLVGVVLSSLFPTGFLSAASLMTWSAAILVMAASARRQSALAATGLSGRLPADVVHMLLLQVQVLICAAALFGSFSWLGLGLASLLVPTFGVLLTSAALLVAIPALPGEQLLLALHGSFLDFVYRLGGLASKGPWLAPSPADLPTWLRALLLALCCWLVLNACRDLTISVYGRR